MVQIDNCHMKQRHSTLRSLYLQFLLFIFQSELPLSTELHHVQIYTINQSDCNNRHGGYLTANMLCAGWLSGGAATCTSDSGGPLYHNGVVVGIVSFRNDCSDPTLPGIYTRVSRYSSWIKLYT